MSEKNNSQALEQVPLFSAESDEALLITPEQRRKRFTARQVAKQEEKLDLILMLIATGVVTKEAIANKAHVSLHTIEAIIQKFSEAIGSDAVKLAEFAQGKAAKFLFLADQKAHMAAPKDLMIMHGIARDTAIHMRLAGEGNQPPPADETDKKLEGLRNKIKQLQQPQDAVVIEQPQENTEKNSPNESELRHAGQKTL